MISLEFDEEVPKDTIYILRYWADEQKHIRYIKKDGTLSKSVFELSLISKEYMKNKDELELYLKKYFQKYELYFFVLDSVTK